MKRPLIAIAAVVVLGVGVAFAQVDFDDVPEDHEHFVGINYAVIKGWFKGYDDNTFRPDQKITTDQMRRVIERAYPGGMTRGEFASYMTAGDIELFGAIGHSEDNPLQIGINLPVNGWRLTVWESQREGENGFAVRVAAKYEGTAPSTPASALSVVLLGPSRVESQDGMVEFSWEENPRTDWQRHTYRWGAETDGWIIWENINPADMDDLIMIVKQPYGGAPVYYRITGG